MFEVLISSACDLIAHLAGKSRESLRYIRVRRDHSRHYQLIRLQVGPEIEQRKMDSPGSPHQNAFQTLSAYHRKRTHLSPCFCKLKQ